MKPSPQILRRIIEATRVAQRISVVGHIRPDGDCIGSQLALTMALRNEGKEVVCWNADSVPRKFVFLDPDGLVQIPRPGLTFDTVVAVDCANPQRLGPTAECVNNRTTLINIDHHASNSRYGDLNWVSGKSPSAGEMIFRLLETARHPITAPIADCLFTAISTDTGSFQYPTTRPTTYQIAGELVRRGADLERIGQEVYQSQSLAGIRLLREVYNRFRLTHDNRIAYVRLTRSDYARAGALPEDSEGLIDHIRAIAPVVVACLFEEVEPELTRISLRSKSANLDVNDIAARFGGGGHHAAAGARIRGRPLTVQRRVIAALRGALDKHP